MTKIEQKIPEGWCVKKLGDIVNTFSGGTPLAGEATYYKSGTIPFIRSGEIYQNYTELFITEKGLRESSAKMVKRGDLLFALYGANSGEVAISQIDGAINQAILCIRPKYDNTDYLNNVFILSKNKILHKYLQGGQGNLSAEIVKSLNFIFPPLAEQEKIAGILSCWDDGIEKLSALIEKKKIQKKALMQQLLTGKHRLKGFSTQWDERYLVDLCDFNKGQQLNKADMLVNGRYPVLNGGVSYSGYTNDWNTKNNTITISEGGNSCGFVSFIKEKFWCGGHCYTVFDIKTDIMFLYHLLKYNENNIMNLRVGSGLPNIQISSLYRFKVLVPSDFAEQKAIAEILSKADEEIELLNKKLEAFKQEKKALMQQLLTGKIRVKVN